MLVFNAQSRPQRLVFAKLTSFKWRARSSLGKAHRRFPLVFSFPLTKGLIDRPNRSEEGQHAFPAPGHGLFSIISFNEDRTPQQWLSPDPSHGECSRVSRADAQSAEGCLAEMGSVTSAFTRSRNTLVKVGSEPQKEPDGKTRSGSGVIAKQTSKHPLARKTTGASGANTPRAPASAAGEFLSASVLHSISVKVGLGRRIKGIHRGNSLDYVFFNSLVFLFIYSSLWVVWRL